MYGLAILLLLQAPTISLTQPPPALIVNGSGQLMAAPDVATVRLGIVRQASVAQTAQDQASVVAQDILRAVRDLGVPAAQIQTTRLVLSPVYAPRTPESREAPRIVAYTATNSVSIRLEDLTLIGRVIDAGLKAGANQLEGVQFALRNDKAARTQALKLAVEDARTKAQAMAEELRVNLVEILEVNEGNVSIAEPAFARATLVAAPATPVSVGEISVSANVTIRYRISPK